MGYIVGSETRTYYVDDDGKYYESPLKRFELDPNTFQVIKGFIAVPDKPKEDIHSVILGTEEANTLVCNECGFVAKSTTGLAVHKSSKH